MTADEENDVLSDGRYEQVKQHYRNAEVAESYDWVRFGSLKGQRRNRRELAPVKRALEKAAFLGAPIRRGLDLPCGTGRLFPPLELKHIQLTGADISLEMMRVARSRPRSENHRPVSRPLVQCDGERLPFADGSFDCVFSLRFMFHLDADARKRIVSEMARVSRRWLIIDFRHRYTTRYLARWLRNRLGHRRGVQFRFSRPGLEQELRETGLRLIEVFPARPFLRWSSEKWIVLIEKLSANEATKMIS